MKLRHGKRDALKTVGLQVMLLNCNTVLKGIDLHIRLEKLLAFINEGNNRRFKVVFDGKHEFSLAFGRINASWDCASFQKQRSMVER